MSETESYEAKENAKGEIASALEKYFRAAETFGFDEAEMSNDIEEVIKGCGKDWSVLAI